jgi:hypothetical protein
MSMSKINHREFFLIALVASGLTALLFGGGPQMADHSADQKAGPQVVSQTTTQLFPVAPKSRS